MRSRQLPRCITERQTADGVLISASLSHVIRGHPIFMVAVVLAWFMLARVVWLDRSNFPYHWSVLIPLLLLCGIPAAITIWTVALLVGKLEINATQEGAEVCWRIWVLGRRRWLPRSNFGEIHVQMLPGIGFGRLLFGKNSGKGVVVGRWLSLDQATHIAERVRQMWHLNGK